MRRKLLYALLVFTVLFALAETALRLRAALLGRSGTTSYGDALGGNPTAFAPHPFLQYVLDPAYPGHNALGFRGPAISVAKPAGVRRVFCLGESSTYGTLVAPKDAYPAQLEARLREMGREVEVVNAGVPGYCSANILAMLEYRVTPLSPDVLVFYMGLNDLGLSAADEPSNRCYERALANWREPSTLAKILVKSYVLRTVFHLVPWLGERLGTPVHLNQITRRPDWEPAGGEKYAPGNQAFAENLKTCLLLARARSIPALVVRQVFRPRRPDDPLAPAMALQNDCAERVARECGAEVLPLDRLMEASAAYLGDYIHMTVAGNLERARIVAAKIEEVGWLR